MKWLDNAQREVTEDQSKGDSDEHIMVHALREYVASRENKHFSVCAETLEVT